jgi:DNA-binding GntR family transcriptional regulator
LVEIEDLRGYRVAAVSADNLTEVILLRMDLEPLALREAMARADAGWGERLRVTLTALEHCGRTPGDEAQSDIWEARHRQFHLALLEGCQMPMLLSFLKGLHDLSDRYRRLFLRTHPPDRDVPSEHRRIHEAAAAGETEVACALLRQHIQRTGQNVHAALVRMDIQNAPARADDAAPDG